MLISNGNAMMGMVYDDTGDIAAQVYSAQSWAAVTAAAGTGIKLGTLPTNTAQRYGGAITSTQMKNADAILRQ